MNQTNKAFLLILDGWGLGPKYSADAIAQANTPYFDSLLKEYPHTTLVTFGEEVGLPEGQMGNSEVGHMNIGAGRIVWQQLARINKAIRDREMHSNKALIEALQHAKKHKKAVHLLGLVSDGGVHSHIDHIKALADIIEEQGVKKAYIHAFTDGRDCDPFSGQGFLKELQAYIKKKPVKIASIVGRYYAMDRDKRWERVKKAYDLLVNGIGTPITNIQKAVKASYTAKITDEFLEPMYLANRTGAPIATIQPNDVVICFNFRTDRLRELSQVLSQADMPEYGMHKLPLHYTTITRYDDTFKGVNVMFENDDISQTIGEVLENAGKTQLRIAETEKYPHVTYFFSGGRELPFRGEERIMRNSPKVATYDLQPEMSAPELTEAVMENIKTATPDFICMNFANTDMVGHTGVFSAAMKAAETVDHCLSRIVPLALQHHYHIILIADHGNSDYMINEDGTPNTAHTTNPVPCILVSEKLKKTVTLQPGKLADVAPTLLALIGVPQPAAMTGSNLMHQTK